MSKGQFTLRDLYTRLSATMKMGPMGKMMGMIPGMGEMAQMANNAGTQQMFKKNLYMMDSMTDDELDGKVKGAKGYISYVKYTCALVCVFVAFSSCVSLFLRFFVLSMRGVTVSTRQRTNARSQHLPTCLILQ